MSEQGNAERWELPIDLPDTTDAVGVEAHFDTRSHEDLNANGSVKGTPEGIRVYPVEREFVVADDGGWVPGVYATVDQAVQAARDIASTGSVTG